jgi:hypothetical protein
MDKPISNFKQLMELVELYPNDQELGKRVRVVYWEQRKNITDPNQLEIPFNYATDEDIDTVANRSID